MVDSIHTALTAKDLLPDQHLMDAGFIDAELLVNAKRDLAVEAESP